MRKIILALTLALAFGTAANAATEKAIVAGGCFWCVESDFESVPGVKSVVSGYTGGNAENPTYKQVGSGGTGHYEAVEITFDGAKVSYEQILHMFFRSIRLMRAGNFAIGGIHIAQPFSSLTRPKVRPPKLQRLKRKPLLARML